MLELEYEDGIKAEDAVLATTPIWQENILLTDTRSWEKEIWGTISGLVELEQPK